MKVINNNNKNAWQSIAEMASYCWRTGGQKVYRAHIHWSLTGYSEAM